MDRRHIRGFALWGTSVLAVQCGWCPVGQCDVPQPADRTDAIQVEGFWRPYHLHVPPSYDRKTPLPLVLVFHGRFETADQIAQVTQFSRLADQKGFIVVYPVGIHARWNDGRGDTALASHNYDDVGFISALIRHLEETLAIDPTRIYATGRSNGAMFVQRLACELSDTLAAIGPVEGTLPSNLASSCTPPHPVSVVEFHGTKDAYVLWHGGRVRVLGGRTLSVDATVAHWQQRDGCPPLPQAVYEPHKDRQGNMRVRRETFSPCQDDSAVVLFAVEGGGHTWPGGPDDPLIFSGRVSRDLSATEAIWSFFAQHSKPSRANLATRTPPADLVDVSSDADSRPSSTPPIFDTRFQPTFQERVVLSLGDLLSSFTRMVTIWSP